MTIPTSGPATMSSSLNFGHKQDPDSYAVQVVDFTVKTFLRNENLEHLPHPVVIENIRGKEETVTLDTAGFQLFHAPTAHTDFTDGEEIKRGYYAETGDLVKKITGASRVIFYDHSKSIYPLCEVILTYGLRCVLDVRHRRPGPIDDGPMAHQPVPQVHVDQYLASGAKRICREIPEEGEYLLSNKRVQILNIWRPLSHPAYDWPLAVCDFRSIDREKDTFPVTLVLPTFTGGTLGVRYSPNQKWKYFHGMTPDEIVIFKWCVNLET